MVSKKHPLHNLEKKRSSFFAIGLAVSLFFTLTAMEWTTTTRVAKELLSSVTLEDDDDTEVVITMTVNKPIPPPKITPPPRPVPVPVPVPVFVPAPTPVQPPPVIDPGFVDMGDDDTISEPQLPFVIVEKMPQFGNGDQDLLNYLARNIKYPRMALDAGVGGMVYVQFVINKKGEVESPKILRGIGAGCDKEALRVVKGMPKWKPGKQRGKKVPVQFTLPVNFKPL